LGTAEVESALVTDSAVAEAAVVGFAHDIKGEGIFAFVTLKDSADHSPGAVAEGHVRRMREAVRKAIGGLAVPDHIVLCPALPKTRSGKVMRRILRKIANDTPANRLTVKDLGDLSTLAEPDVVQKIITVREQLFAVKPPK
jgi:acetyl-CoA synthetase